MIKSHQLQNNRSETHSPGIHGDDRGIKTEQDMDSRAGARAMGIDDLLMQNTVDDMSDLNVPARRDGAMSLSSRDHYGSESEYDEPETITDTNSLTSASMIAGAFSMGNLRNTNDYEPIIESDYDPTMDDDDEVQRLSDDELDDAEPRKAMEQSGYDAAYDEDDEEDTDEDFDDEFADEDGLEEDEFLENE